MPAAPLTAADLGAPLGDRLTFLQFSTGFCAPCRAARRVLDRVVDTSEGVAHVEVDVADHAELAERFAVTATPLVVVLDPQGAPLARLAGVPSLAQARAAVSTLG
ncbi:TlpA family protein disulfide reductase [Cellulomonas taurus]|jgi:thiol-disulfide isomerase/thioredoxin|uniref:TlpA family protein disulfide reductase n=1 Tax=Cellulomonas taurus TaxID=2729175 RepID=UPI00145C5541|nr:thioredoxin family protein [Cellulomonas taurus]